MRRARTAALAVALLPALIGCSSTVDVTRTVTPREAVALRASKLVPVAIARGDEEVPLPDGAVVGPTTVRVKGGGGHVYKLQTGDALEVDEAGAISAVRAAGGGWTELAPKVVLPDGSAELPMESASSSGETIRLARGDRIVMRGTLEAGDTLPDGAHVEIKRRNGFLVFGVLSLVIGYLPAAIGGAASKGVEPPGSARKDPDIDRPLLVPLVGPWIAMAQRMQNPCTVIGDVSGANCLEPSLALFGFAVMGVTQGIGAIFLVAGLPSHAELVEPDPDEQKDKQRASVRLVPLTFPNGGGLGLSGRF